MVRETKYNLLADAQEFLKEPGEEDHKVQIFALFVNAHHHNFASGRQQQGEASLEQRGMDPVQETIQSVRRRP